MSTIKMFDVWHSNFERQATNVKPTSAKNDFLQSLKSEYQYC